jgi:hypothetical protein
MARIPEPRIVKPPAPKVAANPARKAPQPAFIKNVRGYVAATSLATGNIPPAVAANLTPQALAQLRGIPVTSTGGTGNRSAYTPERNVPDWLRGAAGSILGQKLTRAISPLLTSTKEGIALGPSAGTTIAQHEYNHAYDTRNRISQNRLLGSYNFVATNLGLYNPVTPFSQALAATRLAPQIRGFQTPGAGTRNASNAGPLEAYAEIGAIPSQIPRALSSFYPQFTRQARGLPGISQANRQRKTR